MRVVLEPDDAQSGGNGAPPRGQDRSDDQHQHMLPGRCGEALLERLHPPASTSRLRPAIAIPSPESAPGEKLAAAEAAANPLVDHIRFNRRSSRDGLEATTARYLAVDGERGEAEEAE
jgi:hypothetical protein